MFVVTVINFLLASLVTGNQLAGFVVFVRTGLVLDIDYPLSEKPELIHSTIQDMNILAVSVWARSLPVSIKSSLSEYLFISGGDIAQRSHCHLEGLGPFLGSTEGSPHSVHSVDWIRG